jgi:hypothetical protein
MLSTEKSYLESLRVGHTYYQLVLPYKVLSFNIWLVLLYKVLFNIWLILNQTPLLI